MNKRTWFSIIAVFGVGLLAALYQSCSDTNFKRPLQPQEVKKEDTKAIQIIVVDPPSAETETDVELRVMGQNFTAETKLFFGGQECVNSQFISDGEIQCTLEASPAVGMVDVEGTSVDRDPGTLPNGFEWIALTVAQKCASAKYKKTKMQAITIPAQTLQCPFGMGDNDTTAQGTIRARVEQEQKLDLPAKTAICGVQFTFPSQQFRYDDTFLLTYNDIVLVSSSTNSVSSIAPNADNLLKYDWLAVKGKTIDGNNTPYCLGAACTVPNTETTGTMSLAVSDDLFGKIAKTQANATDHKFKFITTGDNDTGIDCKHLILNFSVNITYVNK